MRILQVHNFYQQAGGEDRVVAAEQALLTAHGHSVFQYTVHNDAVNRMPGLELGVRTIWNQQTYANVRRVIADEGVDLVHAHNTLPLVSPAVYWAAGAQRVPVVQTLHNYRLLCPAATFYRQGKVCELCLHKTIKLPAVRHRCYRGSLSASTVVSSMLATHRLLETYQRKVTTYIALTEFARAKFCEGGLPAGRITVKPNFLAEDPGMGSGGGGYAFFAGRLTEEKGLAALLDAWSRCRRPMPLKIAGDGPMQNYVRERAASIAGVEYLDVCAHARVLELLKDAALLMFPSRWYEGMPMIVLEAFACGTPVIGFGLGSMNDLIVEGVNGSKLELANPDALLDFLNDPGPLLEKAARWRQGARASFEENFTAETNYGFLHNIYEQALNRPRSVS